MQPKYKVRDEKNNLIEIGEIWGSKAKKATHYVDCCNILKTEHIPGAKPGSAYRTGCKPIFSDTKLPIRCDDIEGANANSRNT